VLYYKKYTGSYYRKKVLPHPQGIEGSMRNLMNKRLFSLYDPALPGRDAWRDDFDVLK
jgi:hypothetical protein